MTGLTPVELILEMKIQKARKLLEEGRYFTVSEVRNEVGMESATYFSKKFTKRFGKNPKDLLESVFQ
jgi:AraC-like DNA-binding protein